MAEPSLPDLVQLPQVMSVCEANAVPSRREPVRMSCLFGLSPRPFTFWPFSSSPVSLLMLLFGECRSATSRAIRSPFALCQGPVPIRSRAWATFVSLVVLPWVLRYARHVRLPAPALAASDWQWRSAPSMPPRSAPFPVPTLVIKNVIPCGYCGVTQPATASTEKPAAIPKVLRIESIRSPLLCEIGSCLQEHKQAPHYSIHNSTRRLR